MANFYKMDPAVWDATTAVLSLEEEAALLRIGNAIYKAERGCPDLPRVLAGMFRCSTRKATSLVESLIEKGKVTRRDGALWSARAEREIANMHKKKGEPEPKPAPTDDENDANHPRVDSDMSANSQRNGYERNDKSLKDAENGNATPTPRLDETREEESRKDSLEIAFEEIWKAYPRRRQECGTLTKGSKQAAKTAFKKLSKAERELAKTGLPGFTRLYPDDSKSVCDCVRYFSNKRWLDVDGIDEKPAEFTPFPDGVLGEKVRAFVEIITRDRYMSWFVADGVSRFSEDDHGVVITVLGEFHAQRIKQDFEGPLRKIFGGSDVRFHILNKKAA